MNHVLRRVTAVILLALAIPSWAAPAKKVNGQWEVRKRVDKMTDKADCILAYRKNARIWIEDEANLVISMNGRGGVDGYQYRFGAMPATEWQPSSRWEKDSSTVRIWVPDDKIGDAQNVLVRGSTLLRTNFEESIDLTGMRQARAEMLATCKAAT